MATKKQTKADKAFIEKITTLNVQTGPKAKAPTCPGCGDAMKPIGVLAGEFHGQQVVGDVYSCGPIPPAALAALQRRKKTEQSHAEPPPSAIGGRPSAIPCR